MSAHRQNGNGRLAGNGSGLVGMREALCFRGELEVGHRHDGWFEVSVALPYGEGDDPRRAR